MTHRGLHLLLDHGVSPNVNTGLKKSNREILKVAL